MAGEDLIGYEFVGSNGFTYRVEREFEVLPNYMIVSEFDADGKPLGESIRLTGLLRTHKLMQDPGYGAPQEGPA